MLTFRTILYRIEVISSHLISPFFGLATESLKVSFVVLCVCVFVVIPFILDVRMVDVPAGVTQEEGHTGFIHLPSAVLALVFLARRIQPFLSLVDRKVELSVLTK